MDPLQDQHQMPVQTEPDAQVQPQQSRAVMYWWIAAVAALLIVGGLFVSLKLTSANADYICTKVIESDGACANGSWGAWQTTAEATEGNVTTKTQQRIYTGTRATSKTLSYLNTRSACQAGYTQQYAGNNNGASGFHGGSVTTSSSACQVAQTQTITQTANTTGGGTKVTWSVKNTQTDTGAVTTQERDVASLDDLNTEDTTGGGGNWGDIEGSGEIAAQPSLVRRGDTTTVTWSSTGTEFCTVTSSAATPDSWEGVSGSKVSSPILTMTVFTLTCPVAQGVDITASTKVNVAPVFQEQ